MSSGKHPDIIARTNGFLYAILQVLLSSMFWLNCFDTSLLVSHYKHCTSLASFAWKSANRCWLLSVTQLLAKRLSLSLYLVCIGETPFIYRIVHEWQLVAIYWLNRPQWETTIIVATIGGGQAAHSREPKALGLLNLRSLLIGTEQSEGAILLTKRGLIISAVNDSVKISWGNNTLKPWNKNWTAS